MVDSSSDSVGNAIGDGGSPPLFRRLILGALSVARMARDIAADVSCGVSRRNDGPAEHS